MLNSSELCRSQYFCWKEVKCWNKNELLLESLQEFEMTITKQLFYKKYQIFELSRLSLKQKKPELFKIFIFLFLFFR